MHQLACGINSKYAKAWNHLGFAYYNKEMYDRAKELLKKSIELDPNDLIVWYNLAQLFVSMNRLDNALDLLNHCLEIDPNFQKAKDLSQVIIKKKEEKKTED